MVLEHAYVNVDGLIIIAALHLTAILIVIMLVPVTIIKMKEWIYPAGIWNICTHIA